MQSVLRTRKPHGMVELMAAKAAVDLVVLNANIQQTGSPSLSGI
jgi:hypothetical protein